MASQDDVKEKREVTDFREEVSKEAQHIIVELFPQKITELHKTLQSEMFDVSDLTTIHWDYQFPAPPSLPTCNGPSLAEEELPTSKKRKLEAGLPEKGDLYSASVGNSKLQPHFPGTVPCNTKLVMIVDFLKPEILQLVNRCNTIKLWIQMKIPKIEDGNNFGVGIQEDVLAEVSKAEADAGSYLEQMSRYFGSRGKMVSKIVKYPFLDDYRRSVNEYDEKVFLSFRLILRELRNIYVVLYDVIIKNYEKLICPRNSNTSSLY